MAVVVPILTEFNSRGLDEAQSKIGKFSSGAVSSLKKLGKAAAVATGAIVGAAGIFGKQAIDAASDFGESLSKVNVIFGEGAKEVEKFSKTTAKQFGISQNAALDAAGTFGIFGKAAGLTGKDLGKFSNRFTGLASDLASFNNSTPEEAIQAIGAALRGESEPIRRFGVLLNDAALKAQALEMGIYDGNGALTAQQKTLAATELIFKQTTDAQGDFARTSDGLANQSRILSATFEDVKVKIGEKLLPIALKFTDFMVEKIVPAVEKVIAIFEEEGLAGVLSRLGDWIKQAAPIALQALVDLGKKLFDWLIDTGLPALQKKLGQLKDALTAWIKESGPDTLKNLGKLMGDLVKWILSDGIPLLIEATAKLAVALTKWLIDIGPSLLKGIAAYFVELGKGLAAGFVELGKKFARWGADLGEELIQGVLDQAKKLPGRLAKGGFSGLMDITTGFAGKLFKGITPFADGGIVTRPTLGLVGEAGPEAIIPLNRASSSMNTSNVTINVHGGDPQAVVDALRRYNLTNGPLPITVAA